MNPPPQPSRNWLVFGCEHEPAPLLPLRAGPLDLLYDPGTGFIRRVGLGKSEVLRGIYAAVRDRNWGTVPAALRETRREVRDDSFHIEFDCEHLQGGIHFVWHGRLQGDANGVIRFEFDGEARSAFLRNRIGLCVLHPIRECAGAAARQTRTDGRVVECRFPSLIEPQIFGRSSFRDLRAVAHAVAPGLWAEVAFDGDVFEMEDQRNWTDASFKTYGTPLARPFPVEIPAGHRVRQTVTLRLVGNLPLDARPEIAGVGQQPEIVTLTLPDAPDLPSPKLGLGLASHGEPLADTEIDRLRALRLAHLRVDLRLSAPDWPAVWQRAVQEAAPLGTGLELALHLPREGDAGLAALQQLLPNLPVRLTRVLALREGEAATSPATLAAVRRLLARADVPIGAGSDANFCELNREQALDRLARTEADFFFWGINPQVHAFDSRSIVETLEAQAGTVRTAQAFANGKPLVVSPVTLKPRFNAVATGAPAANDPGELPAPVDPRQSSLFAAAWTLGSLATLAAAGAGSVTLYETTGWRGVMERAAGSPLPEQFPAIPGAVFPVYHALAAWAGGVRFAPLQVSRPDHVITLAIFDGQGHQHLWLGNLAVHAQRVQLRSAASIASLRWLAADNLADALRQPDTFLTHPGTGLKACAGLITFDLPPHALARLELPAGAGQTQQNISLTPRL